MARRSPSLVFRLKEGGRSSWKDLFRDDDIEGVLKLLLLLLLVLLRLLLE
jgi:hypothetical protein